MPLFPNRIKYRKQDLKIVTLQVRNPLNLNILRGRRVLPFISLNRAGSLTVEAALGLSVFIFAVVCLMMPLKMMDNQRQIQASLESVSEDLSQYAYLAYQIKQGREDVLSEESSWDSSLGNIFDSIGSEALNMAIRALARSKVMEALEGNMVDSVSFSKSEVTEDGEVISLVMDYYMVFPFPVMGIKGMPMTSVSIRRAWVGVDGGRNDGTAGGEGESEEIVYIGKKSTRYHRSRDCHYLNNNLLKVAAGDIDNYRNSDGGKYHPCKVCKGTAATVYIMESGSSYHSDPNCSSIIAYVKAVFLSEVEYLGACSYCSR